MRQESDRSCWVGSFSLVFSLLLLGVDGSLAQTVSRETLIEGAKKEGEVVWYTAMSTPDTEAVGKLFKGKYPFLTFTVLRQPGEKVRNRILTESRAGQHFWDAVSINHLDMDTLNRQGLLAGYLSPETKAGYPKGAVDPEGRWAAIYVRQFVIGYNTNLVPPSEVPKDWPDLLEPKWKGKFAMDENEVEWFAAMLDYMGRDKGLMFMRALAKQSPQFRRGHSLLSQMLLAGEFPLALVHIQEIEQARAKGAPVNWVRSVDPIVTSPSHIAISAKAPHPNSARLFQDFLLSVEGQSLLKEKKRVPARIDLPAAETAGEAKALRVHYVNPKLSREFDRYEKEFHEIFLKSR